MPGFGLLLGFGVFFLIITIYFIILFFVSAFRSELLAWKVGVGVGGGWVCGGGGGGGGCASLRAPEGSPRVGPVLSPVAPAPSARSGGVMENDPNTTQKTDQAAAFSWVLLRRIVAGFRKEK